MLAILNSAIEPARDFALQPGDAGNVPGLIGDSPSLLFHAGYVLLRREVPA